MSLGHLMVGFVSNHLSSYPAYLKWLNVTWEHQQLNFVDIVIAVVGYS